MKTKKYALNRQKDKQNSLGKKRGNAVQIRKDCAHTRY
jgi:hypothetical protein